jgi:hypothetical protein
MWNREIQKIVNIVLVSGLTGTGLSGCLEKQGYSVLASTGTVIGVEVSQNPATQTPQAKLGYNRAELAFVPTNRSGGKQATGLKNGAEDTGEVLMELRYGGIFDLGGSSGIYQRLAVGKTAVTQPGAAFMFAKDEDGTLNAKVAENIAQAINPKALSEEHLTAVESLCQKVSLNNKTDKAKLKKFFKCAYPEEDPNRLSDRYKNKSNSECKTALVNDHVSWEAAALLKKCP